jgi:hypothetical protein
MPTNYNMGTISFVNPTGLESPGYGVNATAHTMAIDLTVTGFASGTIVGLRVGTSMGMPGDTPPGNLVAAEKKTLATGTSSYTLASVPIPSFTAGDFLYIRAWIWDQGTDDFSTVFSRSFKPVAT